MRLDTVLKLLILNKSGLQQLMQDSVERWTAIVRSVFYRTVAGVEEKQDQTKLDRYSEQLEKFQSQIEEGVSSLVEDQIILIKF